jgi:galactokinase
MTLVKGLRLPTGRTGEATAVSVSVPGRICLVGENADWMGGKVICAALKGRRVRVRVSPSSNHGSYARFGDPFGVRIELSSAREKPAVPEAVDYVQACLIALHKRSISVGPVEIEVQSNLPMAGGLASSGALCVALVAGLSRYASARLAATEIADLAFAVEHDELGINCGQMDQHAVALGGLLHLDCANSPPAATGLPVPPGLALVVAHGDKRSDFTSLGASLRARWQRHDAKLSAYFTIAQLLVEALKQELAGTINYERLAGLIDACDENQRCCFELNNVTLDDYIRAARQAGAVGTKSTGARQSGGTMFAFCNSSTAPVISQRLRALGAQAFTTSVDKRGIVFHD